MEHEKASIGINLSFPLLKRILISDLVLVQDPFSKKVRVCLVTRTPKCLLVQSIYAELQMKLGLQLITELAVVATSGFIENSPNLVEYTAYVRKSAY